MSAITVRREGRGPPVLLVHGGASPRTTWSSLRPLAKRWTLVIAYRRGYPPSPPARHDFDVDADDLAPLLRERPHVVAHSYGALGALLAAERSPTLVRSLVLIEPPLFLLAREDPAVAHLERLGEAFLRDGLGGDPIMLREFLRIAGATEIDDGPLPEAVAAGVRRAQGGRPPGETRPNVELLRDARIPTMIASGGHAVAIERLCDALATALGGRRLVCPGAGHFVAAAPGFTDELDRFLARTLDRPHNGP
jgi:pimeloyl-ACP methyl ester carboxylesterase